MPNGTFGLENIKMARHLKEIYQITFVDPSCFDYMNFVGWSCPLVLF